MKVAFRVDSSLQIGSGHLMRCLTLAQELSARGADVMFVCREHKGHMIELVREAGFEVRQFGVESVVDDGIFDAPCHSHSLGGTQEADAAGTIEAIKSRWAMGDWVVVDHYALDARWETAVRSVVRAIAVIDDLADRMHACDLLMDQNYYDDPSSRYLGKVPAGCGLLLGPEYALLRREFRVARAEAPRRSGSVDRILISFGGADSGNETAKAIEAFRSIPGSGLSAHVVAGPLNPHYFELARLCREDPRIRCDRRVADMSRPMVDADLSIGAAGATSWERCCVGLPAIVIAIASNQEPIAEALNRRGACWYLGPSSRVRASDIARGIERCISDPAVVRRASLVSMELSPGGGTGRVCDIMIQHEGLAS